MKKFVAIGPMLIVKEEDKSQLSGGFEVVNTGKFRSGSVLSVSLEVGDLLGIDEGREVVYLAEKSFPLGLGQDTNIVVVDVDDIVAFVEEEEEVSN